MTEKRMDWEGPNGVAQRVILVDTNGDPYEATGGTGGGGGGAANDRELVITTYRAKNAFTGASVGDVITLAQVIDVDGTPATVSSLWRNQTTGADLSGAPAAADLELVGANALTDAQLRATAVAVSIASLPLPSGAATAANQATANTALASLVSQTDGVEASLTSIDGKATTTNTALATLVSQTDGVESSLSSIDSKVATAANQGTANAALSAISAKLPATLGQGTAAQSLSVVLSSDGPFAANFGVKADAAATDDTGAFSLIAFIKRGLANWTTLLARVPTLGAKAGSGSLSCVPATDAVHVGVGISANPSANFTRPADTTAYASGDLVANNTTAGSVAAMALTAARTAAGSFLLHRLKLHKSGTSVTNASFRAHLFSSAPTVTNGDNGALAMTGVAGYLGNVDITIDQAFNDGAAGFSSIAMSDIVAKLGAGTTLYALLEARAAYTPVSAEVFTLTADIVQD